ncbi:transposase [Streptomyces sioyaensis]|uniref:transposase n=1 Tax=Streptomyces sioyaensis TaxID=67364 RepID=UPI003F5418AB
MDTRRSEEGCPGGTEVSVSEEFRNDAVALYRAAGGKRTYAAVAADVGVTCETLRSWVRQADEQAGRSDCDEPVAEGRDEDWPCCARRTAGCAGPRRSGNPSGRSCAGGPVFRRRIVS